MATNKSIVKKLLIKCLVKLSTAANLINILQATFTQRSRKRKKTVNLSFLRFWDLRELFIER